MYRLGVVSFLNARPLIDGLDQRDDVEITFDVPAKLPERLESGTVDAALIPIVDLLRHQGRFRVISDACIGCDGETMTVRVFSQVPPDRVRELWVDPDSHTSVALARVVWHGLFERELTLRPFEPRKQSIDDLESVLLIGDKVVNPRRGGFAYEVDLGGAWRQHTGLPFVFAVWATNATRDKGDLEQLEHMLCEARDRGVARAADIARTQGPELGWPIEAAIRYLTRCLTYTVNEPAIEGVRLFARLNAELRIVPASSVIHWPENVGNPRAGAPAR